MFYVICILRDVGIEIVEKIGSLLPFSSFFVCVITIINTAILFVSNVSVTDSIRVPEVHKIHEFQKNR